MLEGETNLSPILKTLSPELNPGEYIFYSTNDLSQFDAKDVIGLFREKEGITVIISKELADREEIPYKFVAFCLRRVSRLGDSDVHFLSVSWRLQRMLLYLVVKGYKAPSS